MHPETLSYYRERLTTALDAIKRHDAETTAMLEDRTNPYPVGTFPARRDARDALVTTLEVTVDLFLSVANRLDAAEAVISPGHEVTP